jgi:hypothetical protein
MHSFAIPPRASRVVAANRGPVAVVGATFRGKVRGARFTPRTQLDVALARQTPAYRGRRAGCGRSSYPPVAVLTR